MTRYHKACYGKDGVDFLEDEGEEITINGFTFFLKKYPATYPINEYWAATEKTTGFCVHRDYKKSDVIKFLKKESTAKRLEERLKEKDCIEMSHKLSDFIGG